MSEALCRGEAFEGMAVDEACVASGFGGCGAGPDDGRDLLEEALTDLVGEMGRDIVLGDVGCLGSLSACKEE